MGKVKSKYFEYYDKDLPDSYTLGYLAVQNRKVIPWNQFRQSIHAKFAAKKTKEETLPYRSDSI